MAASLNVNVLATVEGLGRRQEFYSRASDGTTPTAATYNYRVLASADTDEVLDLGDVSTVTLLVIRAVDFDLDVDLDYVSSFDADFTVKAGEPAAVIPTPAGTVRVKNNGAGETPAYEFLVVGTT